MWSECWQYRYEVLLSKCQEEEMDAEGRFMIKSAITRVDSLSLGTSACPSPNSRRHRGISTIGFSALYIWEGADGSKTKCRVTTAVEDI